MFASVMAERKSGWVWAVLAHAVVLAALVLRPPAMLRATERPGQTHGSMAVLTYLPGSSTASRALTESAHPETIRPSPRPPVRAAVETPKLVLPPSAVPAADTAAEASDAMGSGDVTLALVDNDPHPEPPLTPGMHGDVILDITIGPDGRLADSKLVSGLGETVDDAVLATVETWTWHPATRNGAPVASEQELLFHYDA